MKPYRRTQAAEPKKMEMERRSNAEDEPERKKIRRKITSLDDEELWAGFEWEEVDKIQSGEMKPKTLITNFAIPCSTYPERGPLIARALVSVFPNSKYKIRGVKSDFCKLLQSAKKKGYTSLIVAHTSDAGHDQIFVISLLNCATATFTLLDFTPLQYIPNHATPLPRRYPHLQMRGFQSPANAGTARMLQSLFPKVPFSRRRTLAWVQKQNGYIFFRHEGLFFKEAVAGESSSVRRGQMQECGPRVALELTSVQKLSFETGDFDLICVPDRPWRPRRIPPLI